MVEIIAAVLIALSFWVGMRYGKKLESDAFDELRRLKSALLQTGVSIDTYLTGDIQKVRTEIVRVLHLE